MRAFGVLCGVGSLLREAQDAGCEIVGNYELRPQFRTARDLIWDRNFPNVPFLTGETTKFSSSLDIDLVLGHPPCGTHSTLGNSSARVDDMSDAQRARYHRRRANAQGMLPQFIATVNAIKPRAFMLDNLPKILTTSAPPEWWRAQLPSYRLTFITMMNWDFGTPQLRKRLWVVGVRRPLKAFEYRAPRKRLPGPKTALEAFDGLPWEPWRDLPELGHVHLAPHRMLTGDYRTTVDGLNVQRGAELALGFLSIAPDRAWPYKTRAGRIAVKIGRQRLDVAKYSRTITGLPSIHHPMTGWPLTARERARLMQWPDDFAIGGAERDAKRELMRLVFFTGKAVPSGFPRWIIPQLLDHVGAK
jgi:site-specific DNA-cytosine methylase